MVRALAGDSTMTRFFGTAGSVAPGPYPAGSSTLRLPRSDLADASEERLVDLEIGLRLGCRGGHDLHLFDLRAERQGVAAGHRLGRDLDEADVQVREEEDRPD